MLIPGQHKQETGKGGGGAPGHDRDDDGVLAEEREEGKAAEEEDENEVEDNSEEEEKVEEEVVDGNEKEKEEENKEIPEEEEVLGQEQQIQDASHTHPDQLLSFEEKKRQIIVLIPYHKLFLSPEQLVEEASMRPEAMEEVPVDRCVAELEAAFLGVMMLHSGSSELMEWMTQQAQQAVRTPKLYPLSLSEVDCNLNKIIQMRSGLFASERAVEEAAREAVVLSLVPLLPVSRGIGVLAAHIWEEGAVDVSISRRAFAYWMYRLIVLGIPGIAKVCGSWRGGGGGRRWEGKVTVDERK